MRHIFLASVGLVAACATPVASRTEEVSSTSEGRYLVKIHCAACHAIDRTDKSAHRDAPPLRTLSQNYPILALEESLAEGIFVGHPDMPEFRFRPEDVAAILSYLESIQER